MDDHPAGPASPGSRRALLTVVIPVRNGGDDFERCLRALGNSTCRDHELIVVDDGSTDRSAEVATRFGAQVISHRRSRGPAATRNTGARAATAPIVFFLDADVAVHPSTLALMLARFDSDPGLAAVFGSYDDSPSAPGVVSRFRNLLHHFIHQSGTFEGNARPAHTFWTGCGGIRRALFLETGGFDPLLYRRPAIEDIEFGYRLARAGHRILLARDLLVTHMKRWSLLEMIRTDIFRRGVPWTLLLLRSRRSETDLNVSRAQRLCVVSTALACLGLLLAAVTLSSGWLALSVAGLGVNVGVNHRFYRFLAGRLGALALPTALLLHAVYYACCGASVAIALAHWCTSPRVRVGGPIRGRARGDQPQRFPGPALPGRVRISRPRRAVARRDDS